MERNPDPAIDGTGPASPLLAAAIAMAIAIFAVDTFTMLDIAIAVLYVIVVLLVAEQLERRGVLLVGSGCVVLTLLSFALTHHPAGDGAALGRCGVSITAIATTTFLALRKQAADAVLRGQARLLDLAHDAIFVRDMTGIITYWNRGAEALYGWSAKEALGRPFHALLRPRLGVAVSAATDELLRSGRWDGEIVQERRDGGAIMVSSRWSLQTDRRGRPAAILETNTDIADRKRAEAALRRSEAYLAEAQRLSHTGSVGWKIQSAEHYWSEETFRIYDYPPDTPITIDAVLARVHPEDRALVGRTIDGATTGAAVLDIEHRLLLPNGSVKYVHILAHRTTDQDGEEEYLGAVMDVTAARRAEEALQQAQAKLAHVTRLTTLGEITASIAHEVNQPLAGIVTYGDACLRWLRREVPDLAEAGTAVEAMIASARRASDVIARIRAMAKNARRQSVPLDMAGIVNDVVVLIRRELTNHHVTLARDFDPSLPQVAGDRVELQQVVMNLLINAIQAMTPVPERQRQLVVRTRRHGADEILVFVEDSGIGIAPETAARIFQPFFTTRPDGMGMGLSICRSIIERHGGRIWATRNAGAGSTFQFTLPASQAAAGPSDQ
jgi:PAS domain S-box-containing protein